MTDRDAIYRGILADPFEDVPRLAFADCIEEDGDAERAELIRAGCELARMEKPPLGLDRNAPVGMFGDRERRFHKWGKRSPWWRRRAVLQASVAAATARGRTAEWWAIPGLVVQRGVVWNGRVVETAAEGNRVTYWLKDHEAKLSGWGRFATGTVERGFVSAITLNAAAFTADVARAVFEAFPVVGVHLSDRQPYASPNYGGTNWPEFSFGWCVSELIDNAGSHIGSRLHTHLPKEGRVRISERNVHWAWYATRDAAMQALSDAAVHVGRSLAGLPPLRRRDHAEAHA